MRVMVIGAAGALGSWLLRELGTARAGATPITRLIAVDRVLPAQALPPRWELADVLAGDHVALLRRHTPDVVIYLPAVAGFAAEADPVAARRLNVDATLAVAAALGELATGARRPMFVFTSSIAAIGAGAGPAAAPEDSDCRPTSVYGHHKLDVEVALAALSERRGLDLRILRLPTLLFRAAARGGRPTSGFLSDLANAVTRGEASTVPAPPDLAVAVNATEVAATALRRLLTLPPSSFAAAPIVHLPAWTLTPVALLEALARAGCAAATRARFEPDPELLRLCGRWPTALSSRLARELDPRSGCAPHARLASLVAQLCGK